MSRRGTSLGALALGLLACLPGCGDAESRPVRLATTTSARDTGLLDVLLPAFTKETGIDVQAIAVGTGEALKYGERGDADVVLVHARKAEDEFMAKGFGVERRDVWWNRFLIVGPAERLLVGGPGESRAREEFRRIRERGERFVSRGDESGTHKRELSLWGDGFAPWPSYFETGQGMGPTLTVADQKNAYTLTDEGTWYRMRDDLRLRAIVTQDPDLVNPYGVILVDPALRPGGPHGAAKRFFDWLTAPTARAIVEGFRVRGHRAFFLPGEAAPPEGR